MKETPKQLFDSINSLFENVSLKELKSINLELSKKYKKQKHKFFSSDKERLSYIASRMPATLKSIEYSLNEIKNITPKISIKSVLDLGSGSGATLWALLSVFTSENGKLKTNFPTTYLVEKDEKMIFYAKELLKNVKGISKKVTFGKNDILRVKNYDFDLVMLSYVANELKNFQIDKIINRWFFSKSKIIVFIEPGTKYGFKNIKYIRDFLIKKVCKLIAPCPNTLKCPMPKNDWCHFYVRVKRSKIHKYIKGGTLGYEDEKFSYVIATKEKVNYPKARILRFVKKTKQDLNFTLCKDGKMLNEKVSRKGKKRDKMVEKLNWGDVFDV
ncbi:hypothetical protein LCGC14_1550710 [marine sediment metagenome]|uniref:Ribosomal small subunit Rsm22 n=1 Tax=marine sediment metagenome TaxID=412755 RepID=A0A0F9LR59_9ZZZZ|nr:hypothetical protein [Chlamydiota bacterium]